MEIHLPAELRKACDLSTLKLESGSFVEDDLRQYFSDLIYSLKTTAGDGYIYVPELSDIQTGGNLQLSGLTVPMADSLIKSGGSLTVSTDDYRNTAQLSEASDATLTLAGMT